MFQPEELKERLPEHLGPQIEQLWQHFFLATGSSDSPAFFQWLYAQGHLTESEWATIWSQEALEVTDFVETESFLRTLGVDFGGIDSSTAAPRDTPLKPAEKSPSAARLQYEMLGLLGQGAMGFVHLAKDRELQRKVAYKHLIAKDNRGALARFLREAQITAQLDHPHIVPIYSMEVRPDGSLAYSMKLIQGKTFKDLIAETRHFYTENRLPDAEHSLPQLLDYFLKACDAVAFAHNKGVIHRDLKPANIMIGPYQAVYVMDWGIARVMHSDEMPPEWVELENPEHDNILDERTRAGQILGTPRYMSPQQAAGKNAELDGRSDQFALGLILYELLTLQPAFNGTTPIELLKKVLKAEKEPWQSRFAQRKVPPELQAIVDKATTQKVEGRYASINEMSADLRRYLRGEAPLARPDNSWNKLVRWVGRHRETTLGVLATVILIAALGIIGGMVRHGQALEQVRQQEARILDFVSRVSDQGQHMELYFQKMEGLMLGLAQATTYALTQGRPGTEPWYLNDPYALPPRKLFEAPDLIPSPAYTGELSPTWPVLVLSPGVNLRQLAPKIHQITPLRHLMKGILLESSGEQAKLPAPEWNRLLATQGMPIFWAYICLKEGLEYFFPGHDEPTKGYDMRIRPYYVQSYNKPETVWGAPYDDPVGGLMLPCTKGLFSPDKEFLGTVGIDFRINYIDQAFLRLKEEAAFKTSYLINAKGEVVLRSGDALKPKQRLEVDQQNVLKKYTQLQVRQAIQQGRRSGMVVDLNSQRLFVYYRLQALGWYYVVEADREVILNQNLNQK